MDTAHDRFLRVADVAEMTGFTQRTLRQWRLAGNRGPRSAKLAGTVVYRERDVLAWIETETARTTVGGGSAA